MRVNQQPAYVLHTRPWSETSLLVDVFTHEHGRFRLLAKGARRQKTGQRALLQPFQPLIISWTARRSLGTLTGVEMRMNFPRLREQHLASAYYMSELLFKFLHAYDAHESLFEAYDEAIGKLCETQEPESVLRSFECSLLSEVGYGLQLEHDAGSLEPVDVNARYYYYPEKGPVKVREHDSQAGLTVSGRTLQALSSKIFDNQQVQKESKQLLRMLLTRQVKGRLFSTRTVYAQMLKSQTGKRPLK
ncbi:MAG: DNA repair protein RecO [Proteobacteria bacterium]|nr:DNA repair protein RecO [Pseudomonadota bacterium]